MRSRAFEAGSRPLSAAFVLLVTVTCGGLTVAAQAGGEEGVPSVMLFEGYIAGPGGGPVPDGSYDFSFALYTDEVGGTPVWTEEHRSVEVVGGVVRITLGNGTVPSPLDLPFDRQYFLGTRVGDDPELVPRLELMTTAYSFRARIADDVPEGSITTDELAPGSVTDDKIVNVSWDKVTGAPDGAGGNGRGGPPVPAAVWHTRGNLRTDSDENFVGTADTTDLSFRTSNLERMRIYSGGRVEIRSALLVEDYITSRKSPVEGGFLLADSEHGLKRVGNDDVRLFTTGGNLLLEGGNVGVGTSAPVAKLHVSSDVGGSQGSIPSYPVFVEGVDQGIAIRVNGSGNAVNNFVSFWDDGGMVGRIEGQNTTDLLSDPEYIFFTFLDAFELGLAAVDVAGAAASVNVCAGFGVVTCPPIPSLIVAAAAKMAAQAGRFAATQAFLWDDLGVAYQSSSGDYAEWLERMDESERLEPGDVIGVFGGRITRETSGAQQIMVVSRSPIVLGNMPPEGAGHRYEKVAFMGQVPVKVRGSVREGDYIIPSGLGDGTGVAVAPELMTADEYAKVVGRAWSSSESEAGGFVTIAVGLNQGDVAAIVQQQQAELSELRARVGELEALRHEVTGLRAALSGLRELTPTGSRDVTEAAGPQEERM